MPAPRAVSSSGRNCDRDASIGVPAAYIGEAIAAPPRTSGLRRARHSVTALLKVAGAAYTIEPGKASTATTSPGVVLCVADGIVRIVVLVVTGEDLGGRPRRGIDGLIGVAAGEDKRCDHGKDAEPHGRFRGRPVRRSFGRCAGEVDQQLLLLSATRCHGRIVRVRAGGGRPARPT